MRTYEIIPLSELRRQYRRERSRKNRVMLTVLIIAFCMACAAYYTF